MARRGGIVDAVNSFESRLCITRKDFARERDCSCKLSDRHNAYCKTALWNSYQSSRLFRFTASFGAEESSAILQLPRIS